VLMLNFKMMKRLYRMAILAIALAGCSKPEDGPLERITEEYAFDSKDPNGVNANRFLNDIYSYLPDGFNRIDNNFLDAATDDAISSQTGTQIERFTSGFLSTSNNPDDAWSKNYEGIRKVNLYLQKIDIVPIDENVKNTRKAEARFLRAMFYFELVKRYGGVPLVGNEVFSADDPKNFSRNSFEECINYIVNECDDANVLDKVLPDPVSEYGRVSKAVVLALKARTLLYAASPLFNGENIGITPAQKLVNGYASYDKERWNKAAEAALAVRNSTTAFGLLSAADYANNVAFIQRKNKEVIFAYLTDNSKDIETNNGPVGYPHPNLANGRTSPTQELVNAFPALNGRPITETASMYDPSNPYNNRDPRLRRTVLVNGEQWLKRPVETFEGGLDKPNTTSRQTRTGYYLRKFSGNFATAESYANTPHNYPIFRYADVILSYAEARNEYLDQPDASVYQVLYDLRLRAGIAKGTVAGYSHGLKNVMTKDEMRTVIRNERRLELAFEEHRFWDLRRWKLAETVLNQPLAGMKITKNAAGLFDYEEVNVAAIGFQSPKMYFYPIPNSEVLKNTNLIQNTGW
jgi:hypothetical protein